MASAIFDDKIEEKKPTVQVGDPFTEKLLLEACLELMSDKSIIAIQDMGAAGLTSSSIEMASKGNLGIELSLDKVPCREERMTPYEIMLSESQERMLIVLENGKEDSAKKIFDKWNLDFAVIGKTTNSKNIELYFEKEKVAKVPIKFLANEAPMYDRPWKKTKLPQKIKFSNNDFKKLKFNDVIKKMISKEEQTDSEVTNLENESFIEEQKDPNQINEQIEDNKLDEKSIEIKDEYKFGWSSYSEITNGRFAMIGFLAIILIELFSKQSFLKWSGIL